MSDWHPIVRLKVDGRDVPEANTLRLACISRMEDGSLVVSFYTEKGGGQVDTANPLSRKPMA
jgi:hypothetical protein